MKASPGPEHGLGNLLGPIVLAHDLDGQEHEEFTQSPTRLMAREIPLFLWTSPRNENN